MLTESRYLGIFEKIALTLGGRKDAYLAGESAEVEAMIEDALATFKNGYAGYRMPGEGYCKFFSPVLPILGFWGEYFEDDVRLLKEAVKKKGLRIRWESRYSHVAHDLSNAYRYKAVLYPRGGFLRLCFGGKVFDPSI